MTSSGGFDTSTTQSNPAKRFGACASKHRIPCTTRSQVGSPLRSTRRWLWAAPPSILTPMATRCLTNTSQIVLSINVPFVCRLNATSTGAAAVRMAINTSSNRSAPNSSGSPPWITTQTLITPSRSEYSRIRYPSIRAKLGTRNIGFARQDSSPVEYS